MGASKTFDFVLVLDFALVFVFVFVLELAVGHSST